MIIFIPFIVFIMFLIFYLISSSEKIKKTFKILTKLALTICILETNIIVLFIFIIIHLPFDADFLAYPIFIFITSFILPLWIKKIRRILLIIITIYLNIILLVILINCIQVIIDNNVQKINYDVSINTEEYLPFSGDSKIAKLNHKASLKLNSDLPVLDGAAAVFPVYSAFINAVYPKNVEYGEEPFLYTNTKKMDNNGKIIIKRRLTFFSEHILHKNRLTMQKKMILNLNILKLERKGLYSL